MWSQSRVCCVLVDLKACNRRARNDRLNRAVQSFLYTALQDEHEGAAKKSLAVLTELYRRQVWRDARTVNVIGESSSIIWNASMVRLRLQL